MMKKILLVLALAASTLVLTPGSAFACSCAGPLSDAEAEEGSDAVFAGTVTGYEIAKPIGNAPSPDDVRMALLVDWKLDVDTYVKGEPAAEQTIESSGQGTACGFQFDVGKRYLVFAYESEKDGGFATNSCTNTRRLGAEEVIPGTPIEDMAAAVEPADMPRPNENPWPVIVTGVLGVFAALLVGRRFLSEDDERP
jgi:hypothetical protein